MNPLTRRAADAVLASPVLLAAALAGAAVAGFAFLGGGSPATHNLTAHFADAAGLVNGNEVRVAGVPVGTVQSVNVGTAQGGAPYAEVVMSVDSAHWPLHEGTVIAIRPRGVLSNVLVDVRPGPRSAPALDAAHLFGTNQTVSPVTLDELVDVFNGDVRTAIDTGLPEAVIAFGGRGAADLNGTIANLDPLTNALVPLTGLLAQRSPELDRLNVEYDTITQKLSSEDQHLAGLIANGDVVLGALAAREHQLQGTLDHAAGTLTTVDQGLKGEQSNLEAIFQKGPGALDQLQQAAAVLSPLIQAVDPHVPHLDILLDEFVSATGFTVGGVDTLRFDPVLNLPGRTAQSCGGQHTPISGEQKGCTYSPSAQVGSADAAGGGPAQAGATADGGGDGGSFDLAGMFG